MLDSSAVLALLYSEPGADRVAEAMSVGAVLSAVNLAEVATKLVDKGMSPGQVEQTVRELTIEIAPFDRELAIHTGLLRRATARAGLSLGDRACLALAERLRAPALTTDRAWTSLAFDVEIISIR